MANSGRLAGSTAIVTGGSAGIGEMIAKTLAREGAAVAIASTNFAEARRVGNEIEAMGGAALVLQTDVTRASDVDDMVAAVVKQWGTIDILVNAVGGWRKLTPVTEIAEEDWDQTVALNLKSAFLCTRAVAKIMMANGRGRIVNLGSQSGTGPNPDTDSNLPYAASKGALIVFTRHLAKQLGPYGITVNTVSPGTTLTPRVKKVWDEATARRKAERNPLRSLVEPRDSAEAVLFLVLGESRYITGVNLNVNAGSA